MAPKTRSKLAKASKENLSIVGNNTSKKNTKSVKTTKKPLSDITNSASDDNASIETAIISKVGYKNGIQTRSVRNRCPKVSASNVKPAIAVSTPKESPRKRKTVPENDNQATSIPYKIRNKSILRVLEDRTSPKNKLDRLAVYDFTFDPNEEPPPQKKKKKRAARKKAPPKPKIFIFKNNYNKNISKALESLKSAVAKKNVLPISESIIQGNDKEIEIINSHPVSNTLNSPSVQNAQNITTNMEEQCIEEDNRQMDPIVEDDYINSPIPSPVRNEIFKVPDATNPVITSIKTTDTKKCDPLNLQENLSFFDDEPVACSSLNVSRRQPLASPWRADFETLPMKWDVNLSVKSNMTPAYETSFVNFDNNKKHVYTNMVSVHNTTEPDVGEAPNNANWKQTSILSFVKEVVDRKQKHQKYHTPPKANSTPHKSPGGYAVASPIVNATQMTTPLKRKNEEVVNEMTSEVKKATDVVATLENCFGFDDSEHNDQENTIPKRNLNKNRIKELRPQAAAVFREINNMATKVTKKKIRGLKATILSENNNQDKIIPETVTRKLRSRTTHKLSNNNDQDEVENPKDDKENSNDMPQTENVISNSDHEWVESVTEESEGTQDGQTVALFEDIPVIHHTKVKQYNILIGFKFYRLL